MIIQAGELAEVDINFITAPVFQSMFLEPDFGLASSFTELDEQGLITLNPDEGTQGSYELKVTLL